MYAWEEVAEVELELHAGPLTFQGELIKANPHAAIKAKWEV